MTRVDLSRTNNRGYKPGRPYFIRALWILTEALTLRNPVLVSYQVKVAVLRLFGARIGKGVVIKPGVHIKYPWHLEVGDNSWLGESCWIDNFVTVAIGSNAVVSQGAYLCTGNHDWSDPGMGLMVKPIAVCDGAWVGAFARVAPGVTVQVESVVLIGAVLLRDSAARGIYQGNPAVKVGLRSIHAVGTGSQHP